MKVILITGGASGLGWAMARLWHQQGHYIILADIDKVLLQQREQELPGERLRTILADITRQSDINNLLQYLETDVGRLDLLVNNAGITHRSRACDTDPAVFRKVMAVDWEGPVELTHATLPLLRASQGEIICLGSMAGWMPVPGRAGYCAAKAALSQYFEVLRLELAKDNIHVLMVYPSFVHTPIEQNALGKDGKKASHARSVVGRVISAEQMAEHIDNALRARREWLFPDGVARLGSLLWRLMPTTYLRLVRRKFAGEL
ncbi:MAG: SDR family NAD(P)-dependent oxidoreductase [Marinobacter sp.]|nr:SDR family NAD(P)-dependent oxidoreductase [Marinobacter sp.]